MPYANIRNRVSVDKAFWNAVRGNLNTVAEAEEWAKVCQQPLVPIIEDLPLTSAAADNLPPEPWDENTYNEWMGAVKTKTARKGKELFHPIRKALTAQENGPELKILLPLIGRNRAYKRLKGQTA